MLAMQYTIQLSNDYNDDLIRERVEERSKMFDDLDGMAHKAYLYSAADKLYAPFYIWHNNSSAKQFLLDDLFRGVVETFNRPRVRTWMVIHAKYGNTDIKPTFAAIESDVIDPESYIPEIIAEEEKNEADLFKNNPDLYYYVMALDTDRWEMIRYTLWKDEKSAKLSGADCVQMYDVLHVSKPCGYEE